MSKRTQENLLTDILESSKRIQSYIANQNYEDFLKDTKTQDAVVRNLEIIGEATKNLSLEFKESIPEIPWKNIAGMRDKLIHDYFGINSDIVWGVARMNIPDLIRFIKKLNSYKT